MIPTILSIFLDLKCNFRCAHCSVSSAPEVSLRMPRVVLDRSLDSAKELGTIGVVVFTGGEPTLHMADLEYGIRKSHEMGLLTRVVTNAYWARSKDSASSMVSRLKEAGLDEINTSYDYYHAEFMPVENVYRFVEASLAQNLRVAVATIVDNWSKHSSKSVIAVLLRTRGCQVRN